MYSEESYFNKQINTVMGYCSRQCKEQQGCTKYHVQRVFYPCIHYYLGNCKYGFNCKFAHSMQSKLPANSPDLVCFFSLMGGCINPGECKKKHIDNIKELSKYVKFEK